MPLAFAGAGLATVTLSACYGPACVTQVLLPDGTTKNVYGYNECGQTIDCREVQADGGLKKDNLEYAAICFGTGTTDAGPDAGTTDAGSDAGTADAGP